MSQLLLQCVNTLFHHRIDLRIGTELLTGFEWDMMLTGILLKQCIDRNDQCRHELTLVSDDTDLVDILIHQQFRFNHLGCNILAVRGLIEILDTLLQEELPTLQVTRVTRTEIAILCKGLFGQVLTVIVASGDRRAFQQHLTLITDLDIDALNGNTDTSHSERLTQVVTAHSGQTLCQTIAHHHIQTDGMHKLLHFRIHCSSCGGEEMRILQPQLLTNQ